MRVPVSHPDFKVQQLAVETSAWRMPRLLINGERAARDESTFWSARVYQVKDDEGQEVSVRFAPSMFVELPAVQIGAVTVHLVPPLGQASQVLLLGLFAVGCLGGAVGAGLGALVAVQCAKVLQSPRPSWKKAFLMLGLVVGGAAAYLAAAVAAAMAWGPVPG